MEQKLSPRKYYDVDGRQLKLVMICSITPPHFEKRIEEFIFSDKKGKLITITDKEKIKPIGDN